ncbi:fimbrial protein [Pseudomonas sp. McL0111]|uniref:fimbrial protein n=1 Tax=Pseudomonas sp. McL0111 TaxID=3457357 RepID=UPI00403EF341
MNTINRAVAMPRGMTCHYSQCARRLYTSIAGLLLLGVSGEAFSACEPISYIAIQSATTGAQTISAPLAAGVRIGTFTANSSNIEVFRTICTSSMWMRAAKAPVSTWNGYSVYPTGVTGIGYAVEVADYNAASYTKLTTPQTGAGQSYYRDNYFGGLGVKSRIYLVTTAPLGSGVYNIPAQVVALTRALNRDVTSIDASPSASSNLQLSAFQLTVRNTTCDLAAGDVSRTIVLDTLKRADFIDKAAGLKDFEITANCTDTSSVTFSFTGTPAPIDGWRFANTGTAANIGLWFYSRIGGDVITITPNTGNYQRTVNVVNGKAVLPVGMGYFKLTNNPISSGTLVSTVTVNITYQ